MENCNYKIKKAKVCDLAKVKEIYSQARKFMAENGNPTQWGNTYPSEELIIDDIEKENLHICVDENKNEIVGVFCFFIGEDSTYKTIYDGEWITPEVGGVIHRIATSAHSKGVAKTCFDYAFSICGNLRIDTHEDNIPMQKCLAKNHFTHCGIIYTDDGSKRLAYQKYHGLPEKEIESIIKDAGKIILSADDRRKTSITEKSGDANFVTEYDLKVQNYLKEKLSLLFPTATFFAEEDGEQEKEIGNEYTFIIDPIDGTTNFMCGYNHSSISVALLKNKEVVFGAVYDPFKSEYFHAVKGFGAYLGDTPLKVSERDSAKAIITVGSAPYYKERFSKCVSSFVYQVLNNFADFRRSASAALDVCYVAAGRTDGFCEPILSPWDIAAGILILREAGGMLSDYEGNDIPLSRPSSTIFASPKQYDKLLEICKKLNS